MEEDKIYFLPGDLVTMRLDIPNKPLMVVLRKVTTIIKSKNSNNNLKGFLCRWFTTEGNLLEAIFNTKDLIKIK